MVNQELPYLRDVPVRIGNALIMQGDLAIGDHEGRVFRPAVARESVLDKADEKHIHGQWTKMKFDEAKYKSMEICPSPGGEELRKEYQVFLKKKLDELKAARVASKK